MVNGLVKSGSKSTGGLHNCYFKVLDFFHTGWRGPGLDCSYLVQVKQFLSLANYYHEFKKNFAELATPLSDI